MTAPSRPPGRPQLVAALAGFPAFVIAGVLDAEMPRRLANLQRQAEAGKLDPARLREVTAAWSAIGAAAREWAEWFRACGAESAQALPAQAAEGSTVDAEITAEAAAALLGVTPARVRQLAASEQIVARKVGRQWLVDRGSIETRRLAA